MTRAEALDLVKRAARDSDRAARSGMDFRPADPRVLDEACRVVVAMPGAPKHAKRFAYARLGGSYEHGYLPE